jgi:hypothetical protein
MQNKNLREFLVNLIYLTKGNIDFLDKKKTTKQTWSNNYKKELEQIKNLINSFNFVRNKNDKENES